LRVPGLPFERRQLVVDGVADQRMNKPEWWFGSQDLGPDQRPRSRLDRCRRKSGHGRQHGEVATFAQHGHGASQRHGVVVESGEAGQHRARYGAQTEIGDDVGIGSVRADLVSVQGTGEFVEEEGVATGGAAARRREGGVWSGTQPGLEQLGDARLAERRGLDDDSARLTRDLRHERFVA
jgi:hypothetical protein